MNDKEQLWYCVDCEVPLDAYGYANHNADHTITSWKSAHIIKNNDLMAELDKLRSENAELKKRVDNLKKPWPKATLVSKSIGTVCDGDTFYNCRAVEERDQLRRELHEEMERSEAVSLEYSKKIEELRLERARWEKLKDILNNGCELPLEEATCYKIIRKVQELESGGESPVISISRKGNYISPPYGKGEPKPDSKKKGGSG